MFVQKHRAKHVETGLVENWVLNRPDRSNALGVTIADELLTSLNSLQAEFDALGELKSVNSQSWPARVLVITATKSGNPKQPVWIGGGDLKELANLKTSAQGMAYAQTMNTVCQKIESLPIPVIAAIDGRVIGGGVEFILSADLRLASALSTFEFKQLQIGLTTGYGSCHKLVSLIGKGQTQKLLYLSKSLTTSEALSLGLLHEICPDSESLQQLIETTVVKLLELSPHALWTQKQMINQLTVHSVFRKDFELDLFGQLWMNEHHKKNLQNFMQKTSSKADL